MKNSNISISNEIHTHIVDEETYLLNKVNNLGNSISRLEESIRNAQSSVEKLSLIMQLDNCQSTLKKVIRQLESIDSSLNTDYDFDY